MNIIFDETEYSRKAIKFAALYFDHFSILYPHANLSSYDLPMYSQDSIIDITYLSSEKIASEDQIYFEAFRDGNIAMDKKIADILNHIDALPTEISKELTDTSMHLVFQRIITQDHLDALSQYCRNEYFSNKDDYFKKISAMLAGIYYYAQIYSTISSEIQGKSVLTCHNSTQYIVDKVFSPDNANSQQNIYVPDTLQLFVPNYDCMEIYDIVEIKNAARDELSEMQSYIQGIATEYYKNGAEKGCIDEYLLKRVQPAIEKFKYKVESTRISTVQSVLHELKNPVSYSPLLVSLFSKIPSQTTLLASLGIIAFDSILSIKKHQLDLKQDPLFFTLGLDNY